MRDMSNEPDPPEGMSEAEVLAYEKGYAEGYNAGHYDGYTEGFEQAFDET